MNMQSIRKFAVSSAVLAFLLSASASPSYALFGWGEKESATSATSATSDSSGVVGAAVGKAAGSVQIQNEGSASWSAASAQQALNAGAKVKTGADGSATLAFTDGSVIEVDKNSTFVFEGHSARKVKVNLSVGYIKAWIKKSSRHYAIRTPTSVAAVRGTEFTTAVDAGGATTWDLFSGSLDISDNFGNSTSLEPGRRLEASKEKGLSEAKPIPPEVKMAPKPNVDAPKPAPTTPTAGDDEESDEPIAEPAPPTESVLQNVDTVSPSAPQGGGSGGGSCGG